MAIMKPVKPLLMVSTRKLDVQSATFAIHQASGFTHVTRKFESLGSSGDIRAATKPTTVIGATAGAANKLAKILIGDRYPEITIITGAQKTSAAIGGAIACAMKFGR